MDVIGLLIIAEECPLRPARSWISLSQCPGVCHSSILLIFFSFFIRCSSKLVSIDLEAGIPRSSCFDLGYFAELAIFAPYIDFPFSDQFANWVIIQCCKEVVIELGYDCQSEEVHQNIEHRVLQKEHHQADEFNQYDYSKLVKANSKGTNPIPKFPRMII